MAPRPRLPGQLCLLVQSAGGYGGDWWGWVSRDVRVLERAWGSLGNEDAHVGGMGLAVAAVTEGATRKWP